MRTDPKPLEPVLALQGQRAIVDSDSGRPDITAQVLEVQRGVLWILLQEREFFVGKLARFQRQSSVHFLERLRPEMPHWRAVPHT